ncbi:MAG: tetratricopeptide repeat protein [Candidatus Xenobia bacterium]
MFRSRLWLLALPILLCLSMLPARADVSQAITDFFAKKYTASEDEFVEALQSDRNNSFALVMSLESAKRANNIEAMVERFEDMLKGHENDPVMHTWLATAYLFGTEARPTWVTREQAEFDTALKLDDNCSITHCCLGIMHLAANNSARAVIHLQKALAVNPDDMLAHERLGEVLLVDKDDADHAQVHFEKLTKAYPNYPDGWFLLGFAAEKNKKIKDAQRDYEEAVRLDPFAITRSPYARVRLARLYVKQNHKDKAIQILQDLITLRPDFTDAKKELADIRSGKEEAENSKGDHQQ